MRNALVSAALVALLGLMVDMRPLVAQYALPEWYAPPEWNAPDSLAPTRVQPPRRARSVHTATRRHAQRKRHVSRPPSDQHVSRPPSDQREIAESNGYKRVSDLVNFPKFSPGLGILYVKPETLPLGPFLCFDRSDRLVATAYMVPIKDIEDRKRFEPPALGGKVDHTSLYFNPGHPGVDEPHYHFVMWHVTKEEEARVAK
jgi:hypothetical protein